MKFNWLGVIFLLLVVATVVQAQGRVGAFALSRGDLIEDVMFTYYDEQGFNGSVLVAEKGQVIYQNTFGFADSKNQVPLDSNTPFYIASVSKQFMAAAVMKLVEEGKIKLEDPVTRYLPLMPRMYDKVRIHHLLTHTAGIPDYLNDAEIVVEGFTNHDVYSYIINRHKLLFSPGSRFRYSNSGYVLLAMVVEVATGETIDQYLQKNIFTKFSMNDSFVFTARSQDHTRAAGYSRKGKPQAYNLFTVGDGGIYSTTADLLKWETVLNSGAYISQQSLNKMYSPIELSSGRTRRYGYGWEIGNNARGKLVYHTGELAGFRAYLEWQLNTESAIIILSNNSFPEISALRNTLVKILDGRLTELPEMH